MLFLFVIKIFLYLKLLFFCIFLIRIICDFKDKIGCKLSCNLVVLFGEFNILYNVILIFI